MVAMSQILQDNDSHDTLTSTQAQGLRLKQRRKALGMSAESLAIKMGEYGSPVSRGAIANWECGKNGIASAKLPILAQVLGVSESYCCGAMMPSCQWVRR